MESPYTRHGTSLIIFRPKHFTNFLSQTTSFMSFICPKFTFLLVFLSQIIYPHSSYRYTRSKTMSYWIVLSATTSLASIASIVGKRGDGPEGGREGGGEGGRRGEGGGEEEVYEIYEEVLGMKRVSTVTQGTEIRLRFRVPSPLPYPISTAHECSGSSSSSSSGSGSGSSSSSISSLRVLQQLFCSEQLVRRTTVLQDEKVLQTATIDLLARVALILWRRRDQGQSAPTRHPSAVTRHPSPVTFSSSSARSSW